jgi:HEAT repeat protein
MIPYADITETADRRWTCRLLARLVAPDVPDGELDDLVGALQAVSDPRSFGLLEAIVCDGHRPVRNRNAAGAALRGMQHVALDVSADKLRRWWLEGDAFLHRFSLLCMEGSCCPDIVVKVAADPTHPLQPDALGRMDFEFDRPEHEAVKIAGLSHPDPKVRAAAAEVLLWDGPIAAEAPLLQATHDPVPEVAAEAANTLEYYPSRSVICRLHELAGHADDKVREETGDSFQSIRDDLRSRLCGSDRFVAEHLRRWLQPVWDILGFTEEELRPGGNEGTFTRREQSGGVVPLGHLLALLADPDTSPLVLGDQLRSNGWSDYDERERARLRPVLLSHPDQLVRHQAAFALGDWQDAAGLLELLRDADFLVRKSAMYNLGELPPTPGLANLAWDHLHRHDTLGTHADETLATFVRHADPGDAVRRLGGIAADHGHREGLRVTAVHHLETLGAAEMVGQLSGLLLEPPAVTWALHLALLEAINTLRLPMPEVGHLRAVDNLHVQAAAAGIEA